MDIKEFYDEYVGEIKSESESYMISDKEHFVSKTMEILVDIGEIPDFDYCYFDKIGPSNKRIRIDGYHYNGLMKELTVVISKYNSVFNEEKLTLTEVKKQSKYVLNFLEYFEYIRENAEESSLAWQFADQLHYLWNKIKTVKIIVLSDQVMSNYIKVVPKDKFLNRDVKYSIWGIERIQEILKNKNTNEDFVIDFNDYLEDGLQALEGNINDNQDYNAYLAIIPGTVLAELYDQYGAKLLEGNVRSYLANRGKVNRAIKGTIINQPHMFFAYNNGIAATAEEVSILKKDNGLFIKSIKNLQIVNGGQTTASIFNTKFVEKKSELKNVFVPMKLSVVEPEKAEDMIPKIAKTANTQNKVSAADFFSNHPFHIKIEKLSEKNQAPAVEGNQYGTYWFYERARGQYNQKMLKMTQAEKKAFKNRHPKSQLITKTDLAKYFNSYIKKPHIVSYGAQRNFMNFAETISNIWEKNKNMINDIFFKKIVALAILFKAIEKMVSASPWYQNAFRANIVTYSLAYFFHTLQTNHPDYVLNFEEIWLKQSMPKHLSNEFHAITYKVFLELTKEDSDRTKNVTEWAKKQDAWEEAKKSLHHQLLPQTVDKLIDKKSYKKQNDEATKGEKFSEKMNIHEFILSKEKSYWINLHNFVYTNRLLSETQRDILNIMVRGKIPTEKQAIVLDKVIKNLEEDGFKG